MALNISMFVIIGCACHRHAAEPARTGVAKEVPLPGLMLPSPHEIMVERPLAATLGFTSPSEEGPQLLKLAWKPRESTAATESTLSPSLGALMKCHVSAP